MRIFNYTLLNFNSIKNTIKRFPFTIISASLATIFLILSTFDEYAEAYNNKLMSLGFLEFFSMPLLNYLMKD